MGNIASWAQANPDTVKHWEQVFGLPQDGTYDPDLQSKVENYQLLLNQTPGATADADGGAQWNTLNQLIDERGNTNTPLDSAPMRDTAFQAFLRESGAQENSLLDEIRYRTEQNSRDINLRAAGFEAQRAETKQNNANTLQKNTSAIKNDYQDRGFVGASGQANDTSKMANDLAIKQAQDLGAVDEEQMNFNVGKRNALGDFARQARGDIAGLYRRRVDEDLAARDRVRLADAAGKYPDVG